MKAEIDEEKIESFKGTLSLEFELGNFIAVKIIDDRGIESLRVILSRFKVANCFLLMSECNCMHVTSLIGREVF